MNESKNNESKNARGESEKELQKKMLVYRALEDRMNSMVNQQNIFASRLVELQNTIDGIKEISETGGSETGGEILFSLGSSAYAKGTVADKNNLIVEMGAGVALEKTADEAKEILEKRKKEFGDAIDVLQKDVENISMMIQQIESEVQDIMNVQRTEKLEEKFKVLKG